MNTTEFSTELKVKFIMGSNGLFELLEDFVFIDHCGITHTAPKGTVTDGGSIPFAVEVAMSAFGIHVEPYGKYFPAFVIHDAECKDVTINRIDANITLKETMRHLGATEAEINAVFTGVEYYRIRHNIA